jgi:pimeloyl-ACP methyl ester carboxylesterase
MQNFLKIYELFVKHKDEEIFDNIKVNTLIMTGENDIGSTPEMSKNLSKHITNSKVKIVPKGKHLCSIECSDDVNNAIKDFIKNE